LFVTSLLSGRWPAALAEPGASLVSVASVVLTALSVVVGVGTLLPAPALAQLQPPQPPATELLCALRTGSVATTLRAAPTHDPYAPARVDVGERYRFLALALARPGAPQQVGQVVITVLDTESAEVAQPLMQARWLDGLPSPTPLAASTSVSVSASAIPSWQPTLTGWQRVYSPPLGRELAWGCAIAAAGSAPAGWADADATASAQAWGAQPVPPRPVPAAPPSARVRVAWMGDVMLADGPGQVIAKGRDPFAGVAALLQGADLRVANLECVVAQGGKQLAKPWTFRAHPRTLAVLKRHVDVVSLANNHSGDFGPAAFAEMLGRLDRAQLPYFGGGRDLRSAHRPRIIERQGLRIALLGYNEMFPRVFEAGDAHPGIAWADEEQIVADIRAARPLADVVIPYMHWGQEHDEQAHARQRALARRMIEAGADAVVGTHPHIRQDSEVIDGKPVIYSLGNFVFDGFSDADNNTGSLLWLTLSTKGVEDWRLQPVRIDPQGRPRPAP
jgi:hypothetical protein